MIKIPTLTMYHVTEGVSEGYVLVLDLSSGPQEMVVRNVRHVFTGWFRYIETEREKLQSVLDQFLPVWFRNTLEDIWDSFLRFIETGFRN